MVRCEGCNAEVQRGPIVNHQGFNCIGRRQAGPAPQAKAKARLRVETVRAAAQAGRVIPAAAAANAPAGAPAPAAQPASAPAAQQAYDMVGVLIEGGPPIPARRPMQDGPITCRHCGPTAEHIGCKQVSHHMVNCIEVPFDEHMATSLRLLMKGKKKLEPEVIASWRVQCAHCNHPLASTTSWRVHVTGCMRQLSTFPVEHVSH